MKKDAPVENKPKNDEKLNGEVEKKKKRKRRKNKNKNKLPDQEVYLNFQDQI